MRIEQPANALERTRSDRFGQGGCPDVATQSDRVTKAFDERRATRTRGAMPFDRGALNSFELAVEIRGDAGHERRAVWARGLGHTLSIWRRNMTRARCNRVFTFASEIPTIVATSRVDNPSISRMTTMARDDGGNVWSACRT